MDILISDRCKKDLLSTISKYYHLPKLCQVFCQESPATPSAVFLNICSLQEVLNHSYCSLIGATPGQTPTSNLIESTGQHLRER